MQIKVFYNQNHNAVLDGYVTGDSLVEEFSGDLQLDQNPKHALAFIWRLFNTQDDKRSWNAERALVLGGLPPRNIRAGDIVVLDTTAYACTFFDWDKLDSVPTT